MTPAQHVAKRVVLMLLRGLRAGRLTVLDGDQRVVFGEGAPRATVQVNSPRLWPKLL